MLAPIRHWWPAALWAAVISLASTDTFSAPNTGRVIGPVLLWFFPDITPERLEAVNFVVRKCAHVAEYAIFYPLVLRGVAAGRAGWSWPRALAAWGIAAAYAALDEFHQSFVPSRTASPWDVALDSAAAFAAMLLVFVVVRLRNRR